MPILEILIFGFTLATLIVPAGSQAVGRLIELLGIGLQRHGEALAAAWREYRREIAGGSVLISAPLFATNRCEHCNGAPATGTQDECQWCKGTGLKWND